MSEPLTDAEIAELTRLNQHPDTNPAPWMAELIQDVWYVSAPANEPPTDRYDVFEDPARETAELTAKMRNALPRLLEEIRQLREKSPC